MTFVDDRFDSSRCWQKKLQCKSQTKNLHQMFVQKVTMKIKLKQISPAMNFASDGMKTQSIKGPSR